MNSALGLHGLPNINLFPHFYPKTMTVIKQWKAELRLEKVAQLGARTCEFDNGLLPNGPASGRTFLIPCLCDQDDGTGKHLEFRKALRKDPNGRCIDPCPYQVLLSYYVRDLFFHLKFLLTIVDTL